jgi:hypothetical protein
MLRLIASMLSPTKEEYELGGWVNTVKAGDSRRRLVIGLDTTTLDLPKRDEMRYPPMSATREEREAWHAENMRLMEKWHGDCLKLLNPHFLSESNIDAISKVLDERGYKFARRPHIYFGGTWAGTWCISLGIDKKG